MMNKCLFILNNPADLIAAFSTYRYKNQHLKDNNYNLYVFFSQEKVSVSDHTDWGTITSRFLAEDFQGIISDISEIQEFDSIYMAKCLLHDPKICKYLTNARDIAAFENPFLTAIPKAFETAQQARSINYSLIPVLLNADDLERHDHHIIPREIFIECINIYLSRLPELSQFNKRTNYDYILIINRLFEQNCHCNHSVLYTQAIQEIAHKSQKILIIQNTDIDSDLSANITTELNNQFELFNIEKSVLFHPIEALLCSLPATKIISLGYLAVIIKYFFSERLIYPDKINQAIPMAVHENALSASMTHEKAVSEGLALISSGVVSNYFMLSDRRNFYPINGDEKTDYSNPGHILLNASRSHIEFYGRNITTVIVPTHNRHEYLPRCIEYLKHCPFPVIICDSSSNKYNKALYPHIAYRHLPGLNFNAKVSEILKDCSTQYAVLCPDDDYVMYDALINAVSFLNRNDNFSFCVGDYVGFKDNFDQSFEPIYQQFPTDTIEGSATIRAEKLFKDYYQVLWALHRRKSLLQAFNILDRMQANNDNFIELVIGAVACYNGHLKFLRELWGARELTSAPHWGTRQENVHLINKRPSLQEDYRRFERELDKETFPGYAKVVFDSFMLACRKIYPKEDFEA